MSRLAVIAALALLPAPLAAQGTTADSTAYPRVAPTLVVDSTSAAAPDSARPISLGEAIRLAQRNTPTAIQARGQIETAQAAQRSAYAAFIPSLSLNASAAQLSPASGGRVDPTTGRVISAPYPWSAAQGFSMNLDLFNGGRRLYDIRSARAQIGAAESNEIAQNYQIALQVEQQFFAALAAQESEQAAQAQLDQAQQQLKVSVAKVRAGSSTKSDSLRALIQVGNAELALLTARNNRQAADAALTRLVATPFTVTASPQDTVGEHPAALDSAALTQDAERGPLVQQAQASLVAARAAASAAKAPYLPTVSLSYSRNRSANSQNFDLMPDSLRYTGQFRIAFSYPLFNQYTREENLVRANVAADNAAAALRDARLAAQQNLVQYLGALRTAEQQIAIQQVSVAAAQEDLRVQQQRYELGASTLLDVLTSQTTLNQAEAALIQARYNYRVARAQLEALIGHPL